MGLTLGGIAAPLVNNNYAWMGQTSAGVGTAVITSLTKSGFTTGSSLLIWVGVSATSSPQGSVKVDIMCGGTTNEIYSHTYGAPGSANIYFIVKSGFVSALGMMDVALQIQTTAPAFDMKDVTSIKVTNTPPGAGVATNWVISVQELKA